MQTIAHTEKKVYTPEEYLEFEVNSEERHEYINGEIIPMTGGTPNHNKITGNFYAQLNFALKRQPYDIFVTDQRLWIPEKRIHTYPDVMVDKTRRLKPRLHRQNLPPQVEENAMKYP